MPISYKSVDRPPATAKNELASRSECLDLKFDLGFEFPNILVYKISAYLVLKVDHPRSLSIVIYRRILWVL